VPIYFSILFLILGALLAPLAQELWRTFVPSVETQKLDELVDAVDPSRAILSTATFTVDVEAQSADPQSRRAGLAPSIPMKWWVGEDPLYLVALSDEYDVLAHSPNTVRYRATFNVHDLSSAVGASVGNLVRTRRVIVLGLIPNGTQVVGGRISCVFNGSLTVILPVGPQVIADSILLVEDTSALQIALSHGS